jgi:hypothetical protein
MIRAVVPRSAWLTFDPPPARRPTPVSADLATRGRRLVLITPDGYVYDHRAASNPVRGPIPGEPVTDDRLWVQVTTEREWYCHADEGLTTWWPVTDSGGTVLVYAE